MGIPCDEKKIFVYGTLMEGFHNCERTFQGMVVARVSAKVRGALYQQTRKGYPALVEGRGWVSGELLTLSDFAQRMDRLDALESYHGPQNVDNEYERVVMMVYPDHESQTEEAYVYRYAREDLGSTQNPAVPILDGQWRKFMRR